MSNFGLTGDATYNNAGLKLPIKWTAPEAIFDGVSGLEDVRRRDVERDGPGWGGWKVKDEDRCFAELLPAVIVIVCVLLLCRRISPTSQMCGAIAYSYGKSSHMEEFLTHKW